MLQNIEKLNDIPNIKVTDDLMRNERSKVRECQKITEKKNKQEWKRSPRSGLYLKQVFINTNC